MKEFIYQKLDIEFFKSQNALWSFIAWIISFSICVLGIVAGTVYIITQGITIIPVIIVNIANILQLVFACITIDLINN